MSSSIRLGNGGFTPSPLNPYTISGAMSVGDAVYLVPGSALTVARADANDAAKRPPIGIVAGISGSTAQVAGSGAVASGLVGLTVGSVYYLDTTPGGITTTVPATDVYILGVAISTSQILVGTVPKSLVGGGGGASSLQDAYDGGATITTAGPVDIAFTLTAGGFTINGGGAVDIGYTGTDVSTFNVGAGSVAIQATGTINIGTSAAAQTVVVGSTNTTSSMKVYSGSGDMLLDSGAGNMKLYSDAHIYIKAIAPGGYFGNVVLESDGDLVIHSSAGTIYIGQAPADGEIRIGTTGARSAITIGSTAALDLNLEADQIDIGAGAQAHTINIGTSAFAQAIEIGDTTGASSLKLYSGTGNIVVDSGAGSLTLDSDGVLELNSSGAAINIGNDAIAQPINVGTGAAARKVTVGNATGASEVEINTGNVGLDVNALGPIALDGVGASNLTAASGNLTLSTTTSGTIALSSAGTITLSDQYRSASTFSVVLPLASSSAEWTTFDTNFGEVSLLAAISAAKLGPTGGTAGQVLTSNGASTATFQSVPYDISGEVAGTPTADATIFHFKAARAFTLKGTGHVADCDVYPSTSAVFAIKKTVSGVASNIGTLTYSTTTATVAITGSSDVSFAIGNILTIVAPPDSYGVENPYFTFFGTCP